MKSKQGSLLEHKAPLRLHPGAIEHYMDGDAYDRRYEGRSEDVAFYCRLGRGAETVLEYGAGTERLTLPLARAGCSVLAVDLSLSMLEGLGARLAREPSEVRRRVVVRQADMRSFRTRRRFDLVIVGFHTFCHLYSRADVAAFLTRVRAHLVPGGTLAFDVPVPRIDAAGYDALSQVCITEMDGPEGPELLTQRWYQPQEILMWLDYSGFEKARMYDDFTTRAPGEDTDFLAFSARSVPC